MTHGEVVEICEADLLPQISELYELEGYEFTLVNPHEGGRNVVYSCESERADAVILRIAFLDDRSREDLQAEVEYIRYLAGHGGDVADVINSRMGNLVEEVSYRDHTFHVSLFEKAKGKMIAENGYKYREGVPITEYYYNVGKVLGRLHKLSKAFTPVHRRYDFFDKYNAAYIDNLIPDSLPRLKEKVVQHLETLRGLDRSRESYGMNHFDYNDGNYSIDYDTGRITVYDFDNSCFCWYMFDLAGVWRSGTGWMQFEQDAEKRQKFMTDYFCTVLAGYESETTIDRSMLDRLPLFIQTVLMENIVDEFEVMRNNGEEPECDEVLSYYIACVEDDIPYMGFYHEMYSCEEPFELEERQI